MGLSDCSTASSEVGESLLGTAVESVDRWLLLEVTEPWAPKALQTDALPEPVRARLAGWLKTPRVRLQLIRRPGRIGKRRLFAVVSSNVGRQRVCKLELDTYRDLLGIDLDTMPVEIAEPICLVCAHGRRDRCCGLQGSAVFRALRAHGVDVWQTSHLGGHRFAACVLSLPNGLMYGRLRPDHAQAFAAAHQACEIGDLSLLRGRCAYDRPAQAAEIFLRRRLGVEHANAIEWRMSSPGPDSTWEVKLRFGETDHAIRVRLEDTGQRRPTSCGGELEPVTRWVELG